MSKKLLSPKNDYTFKRIFGHIGNEEITKNLLSAIMKKEIKEIDLEKNRILEKDLLSDVNDKIRMYKKWKLKMYKKYK